MKRDMLLAQEGEAAKERERIFTLEPEEKQKKEQKKYEFKKEIPSRVEEKPSFAPASAEATAGKKAMEGKKDDRVLAYAITLAIRGQQTVLLPKARPKLQDLPIDLQQDYWNAKPDMRKYLANKWNLEMEMTM